ncbi:amidophosphoribosyltransferase [Facklamia miroungae]|uniref:Amidophosphoribosyltransferase n=1 Tax=Facklamia miroungae TaxID=120956 RepID=A0A1G7P5D9_9LACT|nr:amidophosphoribosyltransferase [Facklamia miroungae]SDF81515.1 amidophosphoribosyltransferase [Facklamia miroungae]
MSFKREVIQGQEVVSTEITDDIYDLPHEECGLIGLWNQKQAAFDAYYGLHALQHRGQEGAGIATLHDGKMLAHRDFGLVNQIFNRRQSLEELKGKAAIGHVRYATAGLNDINNIQPFVFHFHDGPVAMAHNGNLVNAHSLKVELEQKGSIFHTTSDSEVIMHLIRRSQKESFIEKLKESLKRVVGGFTYLFLTEKELIGVCDPNGFRPLIVGRMPNGGYVMASESCALDQIGASYLFDVEPGQIVSINNEGIQKEYYTEARQQAICSMEFIYFARPDSNIHGINVHTARKNSGKKLAQEQPVEADIVIGVPNSSLSAASGYAEEAGIPYEMGLIKNQYIARTFIQPTQELRERGVRMKLSAVRKVVEGKRIVMVDDSIVRGTTSKRIVGLLKAAGAKEVHVRIASPALKHPCFYGIDISNTRELIAANHTLKEIEKIIEADSLAYLSEEGLISAIDLHSDAPYKGLCMAYFNGDYPTALHDFEREYRAELERIVVD